MCLQTQRVSNTGRILPYNRLANPSMPHLGSILVSLRILGIMHSSSTRPIMITIHILLHTSPITKARCLYTIHTPEVCSHTHLQVKTRAMDRLLAGRLTSLPWHLSTQHTIPLNPLIHLLCRHPMLSTLLDILIRGHQFQTPLLNCGKKGHPQL